ncbi:hypothetical protein HOD29_02180 [archaeon]|jgi:hypothetical protein|nr:hypothetical protein [archaeon]
MDSKTEQYLEEALVAYKKYREADFHYLLVYSGDGHLLYSKMDGEVAPH